MSLDPSARPSRRALLAAGLGSLAALAAEALGRPTVVRATVADGDVVLGSANDATTTTSITNGLNSNAVFRASSSAGTGIYGGSQSSAGVIGESATQFGVYGGSREGVGVYGGSHTGDGVTGATSAGSGVSGSSDIGIGVFATSVLGDALRVDGRASFSRSGRARVAAERSHVDVVVEGGLGSAASIMAVIQTHRQGVYVSGVRKNYPIKGSARIYLNKVASTSSATVVAWMIIG